MPSPDELLERRLVDLGRHARWPEAPDVWPAVRLAIAERPQPRWRWRVHPALAVALAALVVAAIAVAATPSARSAVLRWLGIEGVAIRRVQHPPRAAPGVSPATLGRAATLADARRLAGFPLRLAPLRGPEQVRVLRQPGGRAVTLVYAAPRVLLTEFRGAATPFVLKLVGTGARAVPTAVRGHRAYWVTGAHDVIYRYASGDVEFRRSALVNANALVWEEGPVSFRLETRLPLARALALARALR